MDYSEFEVRYLSRLNPQQREAVLSVGGPVLLLATPGSGKTTVLVIRLGYMVLCRGIDPRRILTMTYTRAAARDMRSRFASFFGEELAGRLQFRTINGVSSKLVSYSAARLAREPFALLGEDGERSRILGTLYQAVNGEYAEETTLREVGTAITFIKNMMLTEEEITARKWSVPSLPELYRRYQAELRSRRQMDYDDQMVYALTLLRRFPDVLDSFQEQYRYLCVDEAQDTSKVQHEIIRLLSSRYENLFMVGDEDQSIYAFRAAFPDALMSFSADHPGARELLIEENYRSTPEIVESANAFVVKNRFRHPKAMRATRESGLPVRLIPVEDRKAQYDYIFSHREIWGDETAVLFRNNDIVLPLIDRFEQAGIPYRCRNYEDSFFTHRIVRDIIDTICFASAPDNAELFLRLYFKFGAGISGSAARQAVRLGAGSGKNLFEVLLSCPDLKESSEESVVRILRGLHRLPSDSALQAIRRIWEDLRYGKYVEHRGMDSGKYFILRMLAQDLPSAAALLAKLDRLREIVSTHENRGGLVLSTIHSSKGLEYDRVVLLDMLDGILPSLPASRANSDDEIRVYEEERRLFYVGMTRARDELCIFLPRDGASFPREIAKALPLSGPDLRKLFGFLRLPLPLRRSAPVPGKNVDSARFLSQVRAGSRLVHKTFGSGTVYEISGDILTVDFDRAGRKKLSISVSLQAGLLKLDSDQASGRL